MHKQGIAIILAAALAASVSGCAFDVDLDDGISSCVAGFTGPEITNAEEALTDVNTTLYAQSFSLTESSAPTTLKLKLKAIGTPTGNLLVTIHPDSSGNPDVIQTESATLDASTILPGADAAFYTFTISSPKTLTAGTYWIVLHGISGFSASNGVYWMAADATIPYTGGSSLASANSGGSWTTSGVANKDFLFQIGCSS